MTRLSEALERAVADRRQDAPAAIAPPPPAARPDEDVPRAWHFDEEGGSEFSPAQQAFELADSISSVPLDGFGYQFNAATADKVVVGTAADATLVEQYRRLGATLHHAQTERGLRGVMVASAVAGEGKTLTSTNLALTLSHSYQKRVLLIDGDLRRPNIHDVFRLQNRVGLGDGLKHPEVGRLPIQRVSQTLWVLTAGRPNPDPMSALVSGTMKQLLVEAMQQFDWVIIDTPPVALMPDANLLAAMIDGALLVVGARSTPYPLVKRAIDSIGPARILGVVLNRVETSELVGRDGYYHYYYYDAGRSQPAGDDGQKTARLGFRLFGGKQA